MYKIRLFGKKNKKHVLKKKTNFYVGPLGPPPVIILKVLKFIFGLFFSKKSFLYFDTPTAMSYPPTFGTKRRFSRVPAKPNTDPADSAAAAALLSFKNVNHDPGANAVLNSSSKADASETEKKKKWRFSRGAVSPDPSSGPATKPKTEPKVKTEPKAKKEPKIKTEPKVKIENKPKTAPVHRRSFHTKGKRFRVQSKQPALSSSTEELIESPDEDATHVVGMEVETPVSSGTTISDDDDDEEDRMVSAEFVQNFKSRSFSLATKQYLADGAPDASKSLRTRFKLGSRMDMFQIPDVTEQQKQRDWSSGVANPQLFGEQPPEPSGPHVPISSEQISKLREIRMDDANKKTRSKNNNSSKDNTNNKHNNKDPEEEEGDCTMDIKAPTFLVKKVTTLQKDKDRRRRVDVGVVEPANQEFGPPIADFCRDPETEFDDEATENAHIHASESTSVAKDRDPLTQYMIRHRRGETVAIDEESGRMTFNPLAAKQMRQDVLLRNMTQRHRERIADIAHDMRRSQVTSYERTMNMLLQYFRHSGTAAGSMVTICIENPNTKKKTYRKMPVDHAFLLRGRQPNVHILSRQFEETVLLRTPLVERGERACVNERNCEGMKVMTTHNAVLREIVYPHEYETHTRSPQPDWWEHVAAGKPRRRCLMCERRMIGIAWGQAIGFNVDMCEHGSYIANIQNIVGFPGEYDRTDVWACTVTFTGMHGPVARHDRKSYSSEDAPVPGTNETAVFFRQHNFRTIQTQPQLDFCPEPFR
jgi:hypothetical protein